MIDPVTGWFEVVQYDDKIAITIVNLVATMQLSRYPRPIETMYDQGNEFIGHEFRKSLIEDEYGITAKLNTSGNPMSNAILERIHQVLGNLVRTLTYKKPTLPKMTRGRVFWLQHHLQFVQQPVSKKVIVWDNQYLAVI